MEYEENRHELFCDFYEEMIDNFIDSSPTRSPWKITGRKPPPIPISRRLAENLFQT